MLHLVGNNRDGMLSRGNQLYILTIYLCSIYGDMVGWAQIKAVRPATVFQGQAGNGITENLGQMPNRPSDLRRFSSNHLSHSL